MYENLAILALAAFAYSLVAGRLSRAVVNGPVVYLVFGVLAGPVGFGWLNLSVDSEAIGMIAEFTLALVLFLDASNANFSVLRRVLRLPGRLLLVGLPLTILLGIGFGRLLFPELQMLELAILATMLAPTDAALGKGVVTNPAVPEPVREGLNVESGLNDGICVPVLFTFLALATQSHGGRSTGELALHLVAEEIGIGLAVGLSLSAFGARCLRTAWSRGWVEETWVGIPMVGLAFGCFALTQHLGGSGFVATFVGGLAFGAMVGECKHQVVEGAEGMGEAFSLLTWVAFGAAVVLQHSGMVALDWRVFVYAVLSLTVIRMLPVFLSLLGLGVSNDAKFFLGWFGPRGLASIVFLVIVVKYDLPGENTIIATTIATVVLSILAHGLTANPLAAAFGARIQARSTDRA
jgi:NhaP-type Na+/H+ or K+/H+ antiporter